MVTLINIKRKNNIMECDYIPEFYDTQGHLEIDAVSETVIKHVPSQYDGDRTYAWMANVKLRELFKKEELPEKATVMWY